MHIARSKWKSNNGKVYESVWLRQTYREGKATRKRGVANLKGCTEEEINAIELALEHRGNLAVLGSVEGVKLKEGPSVGAVWTVCEVARRLGLEKALGNERAGQLALWQVVARVLDQGSRLSAVRLAQVHAACAVVGLREGFSENDLYENLAWLSEHQAGIEQRLFETRCGAAPPKLFLYDVTSSYLEGQCNALGAYGYNRDKKRGKKQIVVGLLCDARGEPVSAEGFKGNTQDPQTLASQVRKTAERFGCEAVTFVGDRGMIKRAQVKELNEAGFHYITAITKPQIEKLLKDGALQMELFEENVCDVQLDGKRLILRRNPVRARELAASRADKKRAVEAFARERTAYLAEHPRAQADVALRRARAKITQLRLDKWLRAEADGRALRLDTDAAALDDISRLDGCYVITTDLPSTAADAQTVHDRYKDLAQVERGFRVSKTGHLELRPIYVRTEKSTRGHVFVVMLAYLIRRELERAWAPFDLTVEEGLESLKTLCTMEVKLPGGGACLHIPAPRDTSIELLQALDIQLPNVLPPNTARVDTHRKLNARR